VWGLWRCVASWPRRRGPSRTRRRETLYKKPVSSRRGATAARRSRTTPRLSRGDYRQFLERLPQAPNKALVEERIEEMLIADGQKPPPDEEEAGSDDADDSAEAEPEATVTEDERDEDEARPTPEPPPMPSPQQADDPESPLLGSTTKKLEEEDEGVSTWVWVGAGAAVIAAGVLVGVLLAGNSGTDVPDTVLGNYEF